MKFAAPGKGPLCALAACLTAFAAAPAHAADTYPTRAITLIVPFPPGGVADVVARPVADALRRELGQPVVIENKGGAGGAVGTGLAARAAPDGYTLLMSLSSLSIIPEADKVLGRAPSYRLDQFVPIARLTADPTVLVVQANAPWKTVEEFIADAKKRPGTINYGTSGIYGTMHVPMEMLEAATQTEMTAVPFTGAGPAVQALLGGQVQAVSTGPSSVQQLIAAGRLRPLAHWGEQPLEMLPDVPSLKSRNIDVRFVQWSGIFALAGTPEPVIARLRDALRNVANDEKVRSTIAAAGSPLQYLDAPAFDDYWKADTATLSAAVQQIGKVE